MNNAVWLGRPALVSALGSGLDEHLRGLFEPPAASPLTFSSEWVIGKNRAFGAVNRELRRLPENLGAEHISRNNRLLWDALEQIEPQIQAAVSRYGAERVAVVIGTSVGGADENIPLGQQQQLLSSPADFVAAAYGLSGLCYGVSTACTSGARALISAARLLRANLCDAVVCGGVDTLSPLTINGFAALEVLSAGIANPFSERRDGINIGEAAAAFVMTRDNDGESLPLLGYGASSDAHHMSSPRPDGLGAAQAFQAALKHAALAPAQIGWINLHGTGTKLNDGMESRAVAEVFGCATAATSTKPLTGHTLGAAGALEAAFVWGTVSRADNPAGLLPPQLWDGERDADLPPIALAVSGCRWPDGRRIGASSSFAFGGNNSVLIIGEP